MGSSLSRRWARASSWPELGDYTEFPINAAARMAADTYDADRISVVPEYQCRPHGGDYSMRGLGNLRIWREIDTTSEKLIAFHTHLLAWDSERTVWMDGRPHPPDYAPHTWQGFSTGVWEGNMLTITTTHLKINYMRRNGLPRSDKAIFTEHWTRHGDYLTVVTVIEDPVYLTEPLVRSDNWYLDPGQNIGVFGCEYAPEVPRPEGTVPNHLPGQNQVSARIRRLVRFALRSHSWRRGNFVSGISKEDCQPVSSARPLRTLLQVHVSVRLQRDLEVTMDQIHAPSRSRLGSCGSVRRCMFRSAPADQSRQRHAYHGASPGQRLRADGRWRQHHEGLALVLTL